MIVYVTSALRTSTATKLEYNPRYACQWKRDTALRSTLRVTTEQYPIKHTKHYLLILKHPEMSCHRTIHPRCANPHEHLLLMMSDFPLSNKCIVSLLV